MTGMNDPKRAQYDNWRWEPAGVDPEVARDLGMAVDADDFDRHVKAAAEVLAATRRVERELGSKAIVCADCSLEVTPGTGCSHIRMGKRGKVYTVATY